MKKKRYHYHVNGLFIWEREGYLVGTSRSIGRINAQFFSERVPVLKDTLLCWLHKLRSSEHLSELNIFLAHRY